jgi:hypothetical protein
MLVRPRLFFYSFFFGLFVSLLGCGGIIVQVPLDVAVNIHAKDVSLPILGANGGDADALVALLGALRRFWSASLIRGAPLVAGYSLEISHRQSLAQHRNDASFQ